MEFYLITFENTLKAMNAEVVLKNSNINVCIVPTPTAITRSCGISIRINVDSIILVQNLVSKKEIVIKNIFHYEGEFYKSIVN